MAKAIRLAKATTTNKPGILQCYGARPGDVVVQAMAWSNGDDVTGVFMPLIPGNDIIIQERAAPGIECVILLQREVANVG